MSEELKEAYRMLHEQRLQIARLAQLMESQIAVREAHNTLIQAIVPLVKDDSEFLRILREIHQVRLARHLGQDVSNSFIQTYTETLNAMLPSEMRFQRPSVEIGKQK